MVHVVIPIFTHGEGKHVGRGVYIPILPVHFLDLIVVHEGNADLRGILKAFQLKHRVAATADEHTDTSRDLHRLLLI